MKRILAVLLVGMLATTALAGCGGDTNPGSKASNTSSGSNTASETSTGGAADSAAFGDEDNITLKVWAPDKAVSEFEKECNDFKALYPDKTITIEVVAQSESDAATALLNDPSTAADVFGFASDQLNRLSSVGVITPAAYADDIKARDTAEAVAAATQDGEIYAYPETADNGYFLVYDKTVVSDASTLEGVLESCRAAGKKFIMDAGNGYYACVFTFTSGLKIEGFEDDGVTQKFSEYDEAKAVATLQAFSKLMHDYKGTFQALSTDSISSGFSTGTCGAGIDGTWNTIANQTALGDNFGVAKLPTINVDGEDQQIVSMLGYKFIGVNSSSQFPRAAQILANYLAGEDCQKARAEALSWGPSNTAVAEQDTVKNNPSLAAISEQAKFAVAQTNVSPTFWDPHANLGNKLVADDTDPSNADFFKSLLKTTIDNVRDE